MPTTTPTTPEARIFAQAARYGDDDGTLAASAVLALRTRQARAGVVCGRCKEFKPLSAYGVDSSNAAAMNSTCRACLTGSKVSATSPEWAAERDALAEHGERRCSRCRRVSSVVSFAVKASGPGGRSKACLACRMSASAAYRRN